MRSGKGLPFCLFCEDRSVIAIVAGGNYWITSLWLSFGLLIASFYVFKLVARFF